MRDHLPDSKARRAPATARSTSSASQEATCAITVPVPGLTQSKVSPERASTYSPSTKAWARIETLVRMSSTVWVMPETLRRAARRRPRPAEPSSGGCPGAAPEAWPFRPRPVRAAAGTKRHPWQAAVPERHVPGPGPGEVPGHGYSSPSVGAPALEGFEIELHAQAWARGRGDRAVGGDLHRLGEQPVAAIG